jgi:ribose/xylose/arabinose/galactoside ABC-type transport system permease subunit
MNKYQRAASLDILKVLAIGVVLGVVLSTLNLYFTLPQILFGLGMIAMTYTGYILFQIRVDQYKTLDELNKDRK